MKSSHFSKIRVEKKERERERENLKSHNTTTTTSTRACEIKRNTRHDKQQHRFFRGVLSIDRDEFALLLDRARADFENEARRG